ncbi:MAG TPA: GWxTD domain-containing protein [Longimicrobiales bacterium]|nr:GWxTD domain-containing protein [Longimicrobiales bacterium]
MSRLLLAAGLAILALSSGLSAQSAGQSEAADDCPAWRAANCEAYLRHLAWGRETDPDSVWALLRWIGTAAEAQEWFRLSDPESREAFLRRFWERRAALTAQEPDERYAEHLRRLEKARKAFAQHPRSQLFREWRGNGTMPDIDAEPGSTRAGADGDAVALAIANRGREWYDSQRAVLAPPGRNRTAYPPELDDRGLVFVRAGEPDVIEECTAGYVWIYWARDGERESLVTFFTMARASGARIAFDPREIACDPDTARYMFELLSHTDARYARLLSRAVDRHAPPPSGAEVLSLLRLEADNLAAATELSRGERPAAPAYTASLDAQFDFLHFAPSRPAERGTEVTLALGLPATKLRGDTGASAAAALTATAANADKAANTGPAADVASAAKAARRPAGTSAAKAAARAPAAAQRAEAPYAVRLALAVTDSAGRVVLRRDTLRTLVAPADLAKDAVLAFHLTAALPPGRYTYALRAEGGAAATAAPAATGEAPEDAPREGGAGAVWRGELLVPELPAPNGALRLSSVAIGRAGAADPWRRGEVALGLIPTRVVPRDRKLTLYYELYGLGDGERYRTAIEVEKTGLRLFGRRTRLTLAFDEQASRAADGAVPTTRQLDLSRLEGGDYRVRIRVRRADGGEEAEQETSLTVR